MRGRWKPLKTVEDVSMRIWSIYETLDLILQNESSGYEPMLDASYEHRFLHLCFFHFCYKYIAKIGRELSFWAGDHIYDCNAQVQSTWKETLAGFTGNVYRNLFLFLGPWTSTIHLISTWSAKKGYGRIQQKEVRLCLLRSKWWICMQCHRQYDATSTPRRRIAIGCGPYSYCIWRPFEGNSSCGNRDCSSLRVQCNFFSCAITPTIGSLVRILQWERQQVLGVSSSDHHLPTPDPLGCRLPHPPRPSSPLRTSWWNSICSTQGILVLEEAGISGLCLLESTQLTPQPAGLLNILVHDGRLIIFFFL